MPSSAEPCQRWEISDHQPGRRDDAGWPRCDACGFRWPCPDVRNQLPESTADELEVVALVDVGWTVWKKRSGAGWSDADDIGGTVIGWHDTAGTMWEDGQPCRVFRILDFPHGRHRFLALPASNVDVKACGLPNAATLRSHSRRLAKEYGARKGVVSQAEIELLQTALTLIQLVA